MVFGQMQKLQDQVFCLQEERNYFQAKYLEQVSELQALRDDLAKAKKEIVRLRQELMDGAEQLNHKSYTKSSNRKPSRHRNQDDEDTTTSCRTEDDDDDEEDDDDDDDKEDKILKRQASSALYEEDVQLRQSAEKLLQWATYRQSASSAAASRRDSLSSSSSLSSPKTTANLEVAPLPLLARKDQDDDGDEEEEEQEQQEEEQLIQPKVEVPEKEKPKSLASPRHGGSSSRGMNRQISDLSDSASFDHEYDDDDDDESVHSLPSTKPGTLLQRFEKVVTSL